jgi:plasmid stability protein
MLSLTIKGVPERLYRRLKKRAAANRRSLNGEVIYCLERATALPALDVAVWLGEVDRMRTKLALGRVSDAALRRAKRSGRS